MKKSTRALTGMIVLDALLVAGAAWMVQQVQTGTWNTPNPAATITASPAPAGVRSGSSQRCCCWRLWCIGGGGIRQAFLRPS